MSYYNNDNAKQAGSSGLAAGQQEVDDAGRAASKLLAAVYLFERTGTAAYQQVVEGAYATYIPNWGPAQWHVDEQDTLLHYAKVAGVTPAVATDIQTKYLTALKTKNLFLPAITGNTDPYLSPMADWTWGSNQSKAALARFFLMVEAYGLDATLVPSARSAAEGYLHYLHGVNPLGLVYLSNMQRAGAEHSVSTLYHTWFAHGSAKWDAVTATTPGPAPGYLVGGPNPSYSVDACCTNGALPLCFGSTDAALCSMNLTPPLGQPSMKSYLEFNESWPANSWAVTENSNGYQVQYIRALSSFAR